ncbi:uncharacterized protein LOC117178421 [Belonocnema kinseyi]|uniref:uncharacterized protein LOC117178421 n=1 Tax=Belonocnema kinseyi TaxID=2817044 RepID=UPI00143D0D31|nr:uncharacterized protein LOC117178421 [Belonocnema kinseyi]
MIKIPRRILCTEPIEIQLHGFSDASKTAYGACIYLRSKGPDGNIYTNLLCSKSRVAPLQTQSIPRLELCGALELSRLCSKVTLSLDLSINKIYLWCDATIVLGWLKKEPSTLPIFESNRVSKIQELTRTESWRYVRSEDNPADCISRGVAPNILQASKLWWEGPNCLRKAEREWPSISFSIKEPPEVKQCYNAVTKNEIKENYIMIKSFSSFSRLIRVVAYCIRFINNCRSKNKRLNGTLLSLELTESQSALARQSQKKCFPAELECLTQNEKITKGRLSLLNPFLDERGLIRVGGRLSNSQFDREKKHPIVLLATDDFARLLFSSEHQRLLHTGPQLLLSSIRERFWPIGSRNMARKVVMECVNCFKVNPRSVNPMIGDLPETRVTPSPPFHVTGVDYAGPFIIKDRKGKFSKTSKCYVSLFVCFSTKALHLELVSDATSEAFIASLRRFTSRRGKPAHMYFDNGTNFVGARNELELLGKFLLRDSNNLVEKIENMAIAWHFIPAYSPHFGGIWEAGVKPITPLSPDPNDFSPLTPAHFLIGRPLTSIAGPDLSHLPENRLSRWQLIQRLQQHFWERWSKEYISELQKRVKWKQPYPEIEENSLVLMKDKILPPLRWKLGRIIHLHPGKDGIARVATVRFSTDTTRVALHKLFPLPID